LRHAIMFNPECRDERIGSLSLYGSPEDRNMDSPNVPYFIAVFERLIANGREDEPRQPSREAVRRCGARA